MRWRPGGAIYNVPGIAIIGGFFVTARSKKSGCGYVVEYRQIVIYGVYSYMEYVVVVPELRGYDWVRVLDGVRELVVGGLGDLGYRVGYRRELVVGGGVRNVLLGSHLVSMGGFSGDVVVLNTEQVGNGNEWDYRLIEWGKAFGVWDYSDRNIGRWRELGVSARKFRFGFQSELRRINVVVSDIDVLFYGVINERRRAVLEAMVKRGLVVRALWGVFGAELDNWIARSKVVLNLHYYPSKIFEIVRCFYLMTNSVPVLAEVDTDTDIDDVYRSGVYGVPYDELPNAAVRLVNDVELRRKVGQAGYDAIRSVDMATELRRLL